MSNKKKDNITWRDIAKRENLGDDFKQTVIFAMGEYKVHNLDDLSKKLGMTRQGFLQTWKRRTGQTYKEYVNIIINDLKKQGVSKDEYGSYVIL